MTASFVMYLNDAKVARHFGVRPHLGRRLPHKLKRVTVGVRWSLPKRDYVPDDNVLVAPTVALQCLGRGKWRVSVADEYRAYAVNWLADNCQ